MIRFIPALTGNTYIQAGLFGNNAVYPRTHGEHVKRYASLFRVNGLSPHSRGTQMSYQCAGQQGRFIPALTGNTHVEIYVPIYLPVYPRTHGEHNRWIFRIYCAPGLSPHSRGTRKYKSFFSNINRFIPALTGNTRSKQAAT